MNHQTLKIFNEQDFGRVTNGIRVAKCMRLKSSVTEPEKVANQLEDLVVSDSLSCSFCNTVFENQAQQRLHYKLDWHRYNLKQRLHGLKSISEDGFGLLADKDDVSSISGSELESENEEDAASDTENSPNRNAKSSDSSGTTASSSSSTSKHNTKGRKIEKNDKKGKVMGSESSDDECMEGTTKEKKLDALSAAAYRHSKVFFENDEGHIFSIYRCLLHNKKDIPEADSEMIAQALESGKEKKWTILMLGGGHFAAAVFFGGEPIVHKTFHCYTVRAKQGSAQSSRDNRGMGSHPKSAGASLRRYNENALVQHVQDILESWSSHIGNSSLILYRAVGPFNRSVLFGGKNPALDKNDVRLRPLPFPTRRATFSEVQRVYDILSTMEIYGSAVNFPDCFPISPRQPLRKKVLQVFDDSVNNTEGKMESFVSKIASCSSSPENEQPNKSNVQNAQLSPAEKQPRNSRSHINRAKPRKSPSRPLPEIVARLAQSSSESEFDMKDHSTKMCTQDLLTDENFEVNFQDHLQAFQDTVPRYMKNKRIRQKKRKERKDRADDVRVNEVLSMCRIKLWRACELGDEEFFESSLQHLLNEVEKCEEISRMDENNGEDSSSNSVVLINMKDVIKLVNDTSEEGNTMLHVAALGGYLKVLWTLLSLGSDPCNKNKKLQTPYSISSNKKTRNAFRRFMNENPERFNYTKSQIPGPLNDEIESQELEKKRQQKKVKREKEKLKKKEFEVKKQEEAAKQWFLGLSDREKRAAAAERRMNQSENKNVLRCFQCGTDVLDQSVFEYDSNKFCSMPCLKEHRLRNKFIMR